MNDDGTLLAPWVRRFLTHHVVTERNLSRNTCKSCRDTFNVLVPFACARLGKEDFQLTVADLSPELLRRFLVHVEEERDCGVHTRNLRLARIRSFAAFVASHDPIHVAWRGQIAGIASKRTTSKPVPWLTEDEMNDLLDVPDRTTRHGRTEHAILLFVPLPHRRARVRGRATACGGPAHRAPRRRPRARHPARKGRKGSPVPPSAKDRARHDGTGRRP